MSVPSPADVVRLPLILRDQLNRLPRVEHAKTAAITRELVRREASIRAPASTASRSFNGEHRAAQDHAASTTPSLAAVSSP